MMESIIFSAVGSMVMGFLYPGEKEKKSYKVITFCFFLFNLAFGIIHSAALIIDQSAVLDPRISTTVSMIIYYTQSAIYLVLSSSGMEKEKALTIQKKKEAITINATVFLLILGTAAIVGAGIMYLIYIIDSSIIDTFEFFTENKHISISIAIAIFGVILLILMSGYVDVEFKAQVIHKDSETIVVVNRKKPLIFLVILLSFILANVAVGYLSIGNIYEGQLEEISTGGDILGGFYWAIMGNPLFILTLFLVVIGALAKVLSANKTIGLISNVLLLWWPGFSWVLAMMGVISPPDAIVNLVQGVEFIAYILNLVTYGTLIFGLTAGINAMIGVGRGI